MTDYINKDNPVFISYSWKNDRNPSIEYDLDKLCHLMLENNILPARDKGIAETRLIQPFDQIENSEDRIGNGRWILMVVSRRYLTSFHCLNEFHKILVSGNIKDRCMPIIVGDLCGEIDNIDRKKYKDLLLSEGDRLRRETEKRPLTSLEGNVINNKSFVDVFDSLINFLQETNVPRFPNPEAGDSRQKYDDVITTIRKRILGEAGLIIDKIMDVNTYKVWKWAILALALVLLVALFGKGNFLCNTGNNNKIEQRITP